MSAGGRRLRDTTPSPRQRSLGTLAVLCDWCHTLVMQGGRIQVFVSYAHDDRRHLEQFRKHTADLRRNQVLAFDDQEIEPGQRWELIIASKLDSADIVVLLVTAEFVASDFCYRVEFQRALERERAGRCKIIPVNLGPVDLGPGDPLRALQRVPRDRPISEMRSGRASAWKEVAQALRKCVGELRNGGSLKPTEEDTGQLPKNVILISERRNVAAAGGPGGGRTPQPRYTRPRNYPERRKPSAADWQDLIDVLRATRFDDTDRQSLVMSTGQLMEALRNAGEPNDSFPARAADIAQALRHTLAPALSASATQASIQAACVTCERLRAWLLDILTSSGV
jgi:TIR domain